jgi:ribosome-binding ATPase YchF (GTP1/OBG family)
MPAKEFLLRKNEILFSSRMAEFNLEKAAAMLEGKEYVVQDGDVMVIRHG